MEKDIIAISNSPTIPGLVFRHFRGPDDFPQMAAVMTASVNADNDERVTTVEAIADYYTHLINCDPYQDVIFAEINGEVVGFTRVFWRGVADHGSLQYEFMGFLVPAWRRKGIGRTILRWTESRLREIAAGHSADRTKFFQAYAAQHHVGMAALLEREGYRPVRYVNSMVRPTLDEIPDFPMPDGLEVRPVLPEHYRAIWEAYIDAFQDMWGFTPRTEEDYQAWLDNKTTFQPNLWQMAWDIATDQIAGHVMTFINHAQNEKYGRKRGYTEIIGVRRPWRKRGLARALIVRSLRAQNEQGMTESALDVDSASLTGATRVYEDCGFRTVSYYTVYRKSI